MTYRYNKTIQNGAESLIEGIENIEMFLDDNDDWNFHDSEIYSLYWDRNTNIFTVTVEPIGCDYPDIDGCKEDTTILLDFHFLGCIEIHMPNVDTWNSEYIYEVEISKNQNCIECWFNGYPIRITSEKLKVDKPRVIHK